MKVRSIHIDGLGEIFCNLIEENDNLIIVSKPVYIVNTGDGRIGMSPISPFVKQDGQWSFRKSDVRWINEVVDQIEKAYIQYASGIKIPTIAH